ncbi:hypothetical protein LX36DRAFT_749650 [Colletotrichum falcatum]|nr:hypothetical protein LX36DRAFT_749650 [Colletotrichum falcatum]
MSALSPFPSHMTFRTESRASVAASDTTYHTCGYQSFNDVELYAPSSPPSRTPVPPPPPGPVRRQTTTPPSSPHRQDRYPSHHHHHKDSAGGDEPETAEMRRQDSGYESLPPRSSFSNPRRASTASSSQSASSSSSPHYHHPRSRGRPTIRRAPKTCPYPAAARTSGSSLYHPQQQRHSAHAQPPVTFFHFPAHPTDVELASRHPRETLELENRGGLLLPPSSSPSSSSPGTSGSGSGSGSGVGDEGADVVASPLPPQATHYWTSDRTRRLEYAAIDAASRGVKGWVKRHLVPDCFVPKDKHVAFDDDTGSVRRYRLELEEEAPCEKRGGRGGGGGGRRRGGWFPWKRSKTA